MSNFTLNIKQLPISHSCQIDSSRIRKDTMLVPDLNSFEKFQVTCFFHHAQFSLHFKLQYANI
jgi:hypothetical protein